MDLAETITGSTLAEKNGMSKNCCLFNQSATG